jgi:hypothetical protein
MFHRPQKTRGEQGTMFIEKINISIEPVQLVYHCNTRSYSLLHFQGVCSEMLLKNELFNRLSSYDVGLSYKGL